MYTLAVLKMYTLAVLKMYALAVLKMYALKVSLYKRLREREPILLFRPCVRVRASRGRITELSGWHVASGLQMMCGGGHGDRVTPASTRASDGTSLARSPATLAGTVVSWSCEVRLKECISLAYLARERLVDLAFRQKK